MEGLFVQFKLTIPMNDDMVFHTFQSIDTNHDNSISPDEMEVFAAKIVADLLANC